MSSNGLDLLLINAPGKERVYQSLADDLVAYEPPIWAGMIAERARRDGLNVNILDAEALRYTMQQTAEAIHQAAPKLAVFVIYGQQPSASTQCMPAANSVHRILKSMNSSIKTMYLGTHPSALPEQTLLEDKCDFVCEGEGVTTIVQTLSKLKSGKSDFSTVPGLWYFEGDRAAHGPKPEVMKDLDTELPGLAWDLLPMDQYRAHNWHCWDHIHDRKGYASLYTSLGCPFRCSFCCINAPFGGSSIRYFSPEWTLRQIDTLVQKYGVKNIKIADEMFVLNINHVGAICDGIIERGYDLNIWAYARVDTIKEELLGKMKKAGFRWFGIGIESGSKHVRAGVSKGRFDDLKIKAIVQRVQEAGIYVGANYIFGLPDDDYASMQATLDLAIDLNTEWANFYSAMAYPGSALHLNARKAHLPLPEDAGGPGWIGYSQHSKESLPLANPKLTSAEILAFRDYAFDRYFTGRQYLDMMQAKFGSDVVKHLKFMTSHRLERSNTLSREELLAKLTKSAG